MQQKRARSWASPRRSERLLSRNKALGRHDGENLFSLKGKNVVVVGGAGGIGRGLARASSNTVPRSASPTSTRTALESAAAEIEAATGQKVKTYPVNTDQENNVEELAAKAVADMGRIHVLVNAQGFNIKAPATEFPWSSGTSCSRVNVRGVMMCCKHFAAHMVEQGGGKIINLSSIRGQRGCAGRQPRLLRDQGRRGHDHQATGRRACLRRTSWSTPSGPSSPSRP